jgi:hypothetical protein
MKNVTPQQWLVSGYDYSLVDGAGRNRAFWRRSLAAGILVALGGLIALSGSQLKLSHSSTNKPKLTAVRAVAHAITPPNLVNTTPVKSLADQNSALQTVLDSWVASHQDHTWAVVVKGLDADNRSAAVSADTSYKTASLYKLLLTYSLFKKYPLNSLAANSVSTDGRGVMDMKSCLDLMIKVSDNPCGIGMAEKIGWTQATKDLKALGLNHTKLNDPDLPDTTAGDVALYLQKLYASQLMSNDEYQYLTGLMQQQKFRSGIPAGCGDCTVADKIGDLTFVRHDAGIVKYPGGTYILAVMTNGASYLQIAQQTSQIQTEMLKR